MLRLAMVLLLSAITIPALASDHVVLAPSRSGELGLYQGRNFALRETVVDRRTGWVQADGIVRSVSVHPGERWLVCPEPNFQGLCRVLDRSLADAAAMGKDWRIRSARPLRGGGAQ